MMVRRTDKERPLYMISVAASLAGVHPQTLRVYERRCLVQPKRSAGNTRLYSEADIERLRLIQQLTHEEGINLAGTARIIELTEEIERANAEIEVLHRAMHAAQKRFATEVRKRTESGRAEIVLVQRGRIERREERA
jgi:MerR family transcriptional regulator/heat shock protein HspR